MSARWKIAWWWIWPVVVIGLVALQVWFPPLDSGVLHDTYSTTAEGQRAFYKLVATQAIYTRRSTDPLDRALQNTFGDDTLCILGPERWPTAAEWDALLDWVLNGGRLVFACRSTEEKTIPQVDVTYVPHDDPEPNDSLPPQTRLVSSKEIAWWTDGHLVAKDREVLVEYDGEVQAVAFDHGAGRIVVVATPLVFSNQLLTYGDNPALAFRLLEAAGSVQFVLFDESLNASGTAKALGVLLEPALRPLTLQLVLLLALYGWWNCLRYGPLARPAVEARHNLVDHTDTVGVGYWRAKAGAAVLRSYLRALRTEFRPRTVAGTTNALFATAARRLNRPLASVQHDVQAAYRAAKLKSLDRRVAARMIGRLAQIRRALSERST